MDLGLDIVNGVGGLDLEGDSLARESLDKDLHSETEENEVSNEQGPSRIADLQVKVAVEVEGKYDWVVAGRTRGRLIAPLYIGSLGRGTASRYAFLPAHSRASQSAPGGSVRPGVSHHPGIGSLA